MNHPSPGTSRDQQATLTHAMSAFKIFLNMNIQSLTKRRNFKVISLGWFFTLATLLIAWNLLIAYVMIQDLHMNDFGKFYYSSVAYLNGQNMYGPNPATNMEVTPGNWMQFWNLNPPHFHLLLFPLGFLSPSIALGVWTVMSFIAGLASIHLIAETFSQPIGNSNRRFIFLGILCFSGTGILFATGQLSLLLLFPLTLAWVRARKGSWRQAGILLGLVCSIKPFLLIFVPYLFLRRQYAALVNYFLTIGGLYLAGFMVFGKQVHLQWMEKLGAINWYWSNLNASILGFLSRTFSQTPMFTPVIDAPEIITVLWVILGGTITVLTCWIIYFDTTEQAVDRAFLLLLLAALLISPLGWQYYAFFCLAPLSKMISIWWAPPEIQDFSRNGRLEHGRTILLYLSIPGMLLPYMVVKLFQPTPWVTALLGSAYFWSILFLWFGVFLDGCIRNLETLRSVLSPKHSLTHMAL